MRKKHSYSSYRSKDGRHIVYYWPVCKRCGKDKGKSKSKLCNVCSHYGPKKGLIDFSCPHCSKSLGRDSLIKTLYWAGAGSDTLGNVFGITKQRVLQIVAKRTLTTYTEL